MGWLKEERRARKRLEREQKETNRHNMMMASQTVSVFMDTLRKRNVHNTLVYAAESFVPPAERGKPFAAFINARADMDERCPITGNASTYQKNKNNLCTILSGTSLGLDLGVNPRHGNSSTFLLRIGDANLGLSWLGFASFLIASSVNVYAGKYDTMWSVIASRVLDHAHAARMAAEGANPRIVLTQEEADYIVGVVRNVEQRRIDLDTCTVFLNIVSRFYNRTADMVRDFPIIGEMFDEFDVDYAKHNHTIRTSPRISRGIHDPHTCTTLLMVEAKLVKPALTRIRALRAVLNSDAVELTNTISANESVQGAFVSRDSGTTITAQGRVALYHRIKMLPQLLLGLLTHVTASDAETFFV